MTFFAFEGFRVITNCAEDMPEPYKTLAWGEIDLLSQAQTVLTVSGNRLC